MTDNKDMKRTHTRSCQHTGTLTAIRRVIELRLLVAKQIQVVKICCFTLAKDWNGWFRRFSFNFDVQ